MTHRRHSTTPGSVLTEPAIRRTAELFFLGVLPVLALVLALAAYAGDDRLALDFHHEVYRQADAVVHGRAMSTTRQTQTSPTARTSLWPIAAVLPVVPLTALPPDVADWLATALVLAALVARAVAARGPRLARIRRRPPLAGRDRGGPDRQRLASAHAARRGHVALPRPRGDRRNRARLRRSRSSCSSGPSSYGWRSSAGARAAAVAAATAAASLLLLLPFTSIADYVRLLRNLGRTFEHDAYTPFALLTDFGVPDTAARAMTVALGLAVLGLAWRRRSLGLALAAALVLSPIVWRHFFVLLMVPLALSRPRFDAVWLIPIGLWVGDGTLNGAPWQTATVLALVTLTFVLCEWRPRTDRQPSLTSMRRRCRGVEGGRPVPPSLRACCSSPLSRSSSRWRCSRWRQSTSSLSVDFHNELYPEAKKLLDWENPFPPPGSAIWYGHNLIWPPVAAFLVAPLTVSPPGAADWAIALVGLACFMGSLRIVGVRDWRVYGAFALWPQVIGEIRVSHLTPLLCVLLALVWRYRDAKLAPGLALGLAGRDQVLPLARRDLARGDRPRARGCRRRRASPPRRSCSCCRSRASTTTSMC